MFILTDDGSSTVKLIRNLSTVILKYGALPIPFLEALSVSVINTIVSRIVGGRRNVSCNYQILS